MAYNDDVVLQRLSALNETQDSITTTSQWVMFHRRHADRTVQLWLERLRDSPSNKRLNLIYLANDVAQMSKKRRKDDFLIAFAPIIAEATSLAYKGAPADIRNKLMRVIDVWKERAVFEPSVQAAIESRIQELDRIRTGTQTVVNFGGSPSGGADVPAQLKTLVSAYQNTSKQSQPAKSAGSSAQQDYDKLMDPSNSMPPAPVYAARLNGLLKTLAAAEGTVSECVKARRELVTELESLLATHNTELDEDEKTLAQLTARKTEIEEKKQDVEMSIMRGLEPTEGQDVPVATAEDAAPAPEMDPPEVEALTPPEMNDYSPLEPMATFGALPVVPGPEPTAAAATAVDETPAQYTSNWPNKRRRVDDDFPDLGGDDGIDADVKEMLRKEGSVH